MLVGASVCAVSHRRVSVRNELIVVRTECLPSLLRTLVQDDDHEGAHQEGSVRLLVVVQAGVVVDLIVLVLLIVHEFLKLLAEQVHFT